MITDLNGSAPTVQLCVVMIPAPNGMALVYTLSNGTYVGRLEVESMSKDMLRLIANHFQSHVAAETGGVQIAGAIPGLKPNA